jgi:peptidoglycan/LPS O-acetylase OafA/YrhL
MKILKATTAPLNIGINKRYYEYDFIRGLAVLLVIVGHYLCHYHNYMSYGERFLKIHGIGVGMFFYKRLPYIP